ncbi:MAG: caspase family protein [Byssovorax sp.]
MLGPLLAVSALHCAAGPEVTVPAAPVAAAAGPPLPPAASAAPRRAPRQVIEGTHAGAIADLSFSPSGRLLATSGADGTLRIWDPDKQHQLLMIRPGGAARITWLPGEQQIVAAVAGFKEGFEHFSVLRADLAAGTTRELPFPRALYRIVRVQWADGTRWVGATYDDVGRFDDEGKPLGVLAARDGSWRPRHESLEVADDASTVRIVFENESKGPFERPIKTLAWDDGQERDPTSLEARFERPLPGEDERIARAMPGFRPSSVARSRDGKTLFAGGVHARARGEAVLASLDVQSVGPVRELRFPDLGARDQWAPGGDEIKPIAISPDGKLIAAGSWEGRIWLVDARSFALRGALGGDRAPRLASDLAFTTDGRLVVLSEDHVSTFSLATGARKANLDAPGAMRFSRRGEALEIASARDKGCLVLDRLDPGRAVSAGTPRCTLPHVVDAASDAHKLLARGGGRILFSGLDAASLLDLDRGAEVKIGGDEPRCSGVTVPSVIADDGSFAASWSYRGKMDRTTFCVFDGATGKTERVIELPRMSWSVLAPDGRAVAGVSGGKLSVFALPGGESRWSMPVEPGEELAALGPGGKVAVVRSDLRIRAFSEGTELGAAAVSATDPSPAQIDGSGRWAVAPGPDGGLRIWDLRRMVLTVTLVDFKDDEWIALSPRGAYTGTSEVADRVGWVYEAPLEHFSFEQFSASYRDPALIAARLGGSGADVESSIGRPPRVELAGPPEVRADAATVRLRARVRSEERVDTLRAFVEGRPIAERAVCKAEGEVDLDLPLLPGNNHLDLVAFDSRGFSSNPAVATVVGRRDPSRLPDLWVVSVGVSRYPRLPESLQLGVAHEDARAVSRALTGEEGKSYAHVHASTLLDQDATPAAIRAAIAGLSAMKPDDVAVIFFAGHGFKLGAGKAMVFATGQVKLDAAGTGVDAASAVADTVGWSEIAEGIAGARGRVLVLLDACHSGHLSQELLVPNAAMASDLSRQGRAGAVVFAAAKGRQLSLEPATSRSLDLSDEQKALVIPKVPEVHGFFTGALLGALGDAATDRDASGSIELSELMDEVTRRVTRATGGAQTPWVARAEMFGDFALVERARR